MEFVHTPYIPLDTIAAIATPPGEGGVAIIRITGKEAVNVASRIFSKDVHAFKTHTAHYGHILDAKGQIVDDVLLMPMLGSKSYCGEDTIEIFCHGGSLIARKVLETALAAGARAAWPGEFTFKAFMNGKIDLAQAEAVQALIHAKNERMLDAAENQIQGRLSRMVNEMQGRLNVIGAILEAWVDFPDEGLEFEPMEKVIADLKREISRLDHLSSTFHQGRIIHDGLKMALIGSPNVGKSSLMNAILDKERAIVSDIPGTTRDILEDHMRLNGLNIRLVDTAGIRQTHETIEKEGIRRSKQALEEADLVLLVLDASRPLDMEDQQLLDSVPSHKTLVIWNKVDLSSPPSEGIHVSAKTRQGIETLLSHIETKIWRSPPPSKEEIVITNVRHLEALLDASKAFSRVVDGLENNRSPEFVSIDMRDGLSALGKILGTNVSEDILSAIFNKFCIGK